MKNYSATTIFNQLLNEKKIEQDYEVKFNFLIGKSFKVPINNQYRINCDKCGNRTWGKIDFIKNKMTARFVYA